MSEIIDILTVPYNQAPHFTVDIDAIDGHVPVTTTVQGILSVWGLNGQMYAFQKRDNIRLLTAGFYIPESFTTSDYYTLTDTVNPANHLTLYVYNRENNLVASIPGYGSSSDGSFTLPFPNYEHALDLYCDIANLTGITAYHIVGNVFYLRAVLACNNISMIGVPSALDGKTITILPFIKILHTVPVVRHSRSAGLTRSGSTATAHFSVVPHGFADGSTVKISGATQTEYNGQYVITIVDDYSFTYTITGTPVSPATGTPLAAIIF